MASTEAQSGSDFNGYEVSASNPPIWRRLFHLIAGSSVPVAGIFVPEDGMVIALAVLAAGGLSLDLLRFRIGWLNQVFLRWFAPLLKAEEGHRITGATYMLIAAVIVFYLFGTTIAVAAMMFLALGDPVAALVGRRMPGPRFWGSSRTRWIRPTAETGPTAQPPSRWPLVRRVWYVWSPGSSPPTLPRGCLFSRFPYRRGARA